MSEFAGMCVGGPRSGAHLKFDRPWYEVAVAPHLHLYDAAPNLPVTETVTIQKHTYRFMEWIADRKTGERVGIWAHESLKTEGEVMRALLDGYHSSATLRY